MIKKQFGTENSKICSKNIRKIGFSNKEPPIGFVQKLIKC